MRTPPDRAEEGEQFHPANPKAPALTPAATSLNGTAVTPPILAVDDDTLVLAALRETLCQARYNVVAFSEPKAAMEELKCTDFSIVISDQRMPGLSGLELLAEARRLQPRATRILITGVLNLDVVVDAINKGEIYRFIVKPWLREEFLATIQNSLQRYELLSQNAHLQAATQSMNAQLVELNRSQEQQVHLAARQNRQLEQMNGVLEASFLHSLELCVHTMQTFYPSLGSQARDTARLCRAMAGVARLSTEERRILESAALLHDIGLVGVPRQIIRRWQADPHDLNSAEETLIRQHPILGQEMAAFGSGLDKVGEVIRAHHERFDGMGYPDASQNQDIPPLARLLCVAVGYLSSPLPSPDALDSIKLAAGSAYEPEAVRVFLEALPQAQLPCRLGRRQHEDLPLALMPIREDERQVTITDLRPGMVLACGVYSSNGLLLLPEGQRLNPTAIEKLINHHRVRPITQSLTVHC